MKINGIDIELEPGLELIIEDEGRRLRVRHKEIESSFATHHKYMPFCIPLVTPQTPLRVEPLRTLPVPNHAPSTGDPMPAAPTIYCGNDITIHGYPPVRYGC